MQVFVVCSAAAIIFLVCRFILFGCGYDEEDRDYTSRPYWASSSHNESLNPVSSARAKSTLRILEHGRKESRSSISPQAERDLVTALANRLLSDESKNLTAEDLRERARNMRQDHQEALKRANRAYKKKDYAAAARQQTRRSRNPELDGTLESIGGRGHFHQEEQGTALYCDVRDEMMPRVGHAKTSCLRFQGRTDGMIDLHGLHVEEALGYAKQEFDSKSGVLGDDKVARFIVGTLSLL